MPGQPSSEPLVACDVPSEPVPRSVTCSGGARKSRGHQAKWLTVVHRGTGASVTFEPGARTAWHTHPLGQTLIVTAGCGRAQRWGGPIEALRHIATQERLDGRNVDWMEPVTDEQYQGQTGGILAK
jgi:hypothetical protein